MFPDPCKSWTFYTCLKSVYKPNLSLFSSYFASHILSYAARRRQLTFRGFDILSKYLLDRSTFISNVFYLPSYHRQQICQLFHPFITQVAVSLASNNLSPFPQLLPTTRPLSQSNLEKEKWSWKNQAP